MIVAIALLLLFQLLGEIIVRGLGWPVPGPVLGMALLFLALVIRGGVPDTLKTAAGGLLQHLSLLFIPAGTGIIVHIGRIKDEGLAIGVTLVVSTLATIAVTGLILKGVERLRRRGGKAPT